MSESDWRRRRDEQLGRRTWEAHGLVGKTIAAAHVRAHDDEYDCQNLLVLTMTDGTVWRVAATYGGYTGHSCDEYPEYLRVSQAEPDSDSERETRS